MTSDSLEEVRQRLLREEKVQGMIRARAYEIYLMRGLQAGGALQDWFQAESEVLAFLLANYSARAAEKDADHVAASVTSTPHEPVVSRQKQRSTTKKAAVRKTATKPRAAKKSAESTTKRSRKQPKSDE